MEKWNISKNQELFISILLIILISIIAFAPFINRLSYDGDDWYGAWGSFTSGPSKLIEISSVDRPFAGVVGALFYILIGDRPITWQFANLGMRIAGALLFFWLVRLLWPQQKKATLFMGLLYAIYPGFLMMPEARGYMSLIFGINLGLFLVVATIKMVESKVNWQTLLWACLSGVAMLGCVLMFEWYIGVIGFAVAVVFYLFWRQPNSRWRSNLLSTLKYCLPMLIATAGFLVWRVFFFTNMRGATDINSMISYYLNTPMHMILHSGLGLFRSFLKSVFVTWLESLSGLWVVDHLSVLVEAIFFGALGMALFAAALWLFTRFHPKKDRESEMMGKKNEDWLKPALLIGFLGIIFTLLPVVLTGREAEISGSFSRYTLNSIAPISIFLVALVALIVRKPIFQYTIIACLIGSAIMIHNLNAYRESQIMQRQLNFWWQLSWRAPDIQDGTVVMPIINDRSNFYNNWTIFPQLNLIYRPDQKQIKVGSLVLDTPSAGDILLGRKINEIDFRSINFTIDYQKILLLFQDYSRGSCLHVLDGNELDILTNEQPLISLIAPYSKPGQIDTSAQGHIPPEVIFGSEPKHDWCFYYQKASLAQQKGDWDAILTIKKEVDAIGEHPLDVSEWLPFFEAYALKQQNREAADIALQMKSDLKMVSSICQKMPDQKPASFAIFDDTTYAFMKQTLCINS